MIPQQTISTEMTRQNGNFLQGVCAFVCVPAHVITASQFLLTLSCLLFSFWMLSKVYFSERLWRILNRREPRLEARDSSSSMMSLGTLIFFPRSISISGHKETNKGLRRLWVLYTYLCIDQTSDKFIFLFLVLPPLKPH